MAFKCIDNCEAKCCAKIPFEKSFLKANKSKIQKKFNIKILKNGMIQPETEDNYCIFLNKEKKCAIYKMRPFICKIFGTTKELRCPYVDLDGRVRSKEESESVKMEIKGWIQFVKLMQEELI